MKGLRFVMFPSFQMHSAYKGTATTPEQVHRSTSCGVMFMNTIPDWFFFVSIFWFGLVWFDLIWWPLFWLTTVNVKPIVWVRHLTCGSKHSALDCIIVRLTFWLFLSCMTSFPMISMNLLGIKWEVIIKKHVFNAFLRFLLIIGHARIFFFFFPMIFDQYCAFGLSFFVRSVVGIV